MEFRELRSALCSKGAREDPTKDHVFFYIEVNGKAFRATKLSHGARGQISDELFSLIARQMRLKTAELRKFVECPLGSEEWVRLWSERGGIWGR